MTILHNHLQPTELNYRVDGWWHPNYGDVEIYEVFPVITFVVIGIVFGYLENIMLYLYSQSPPVSNSSPLDGKIKIKVWPTLKYMFGGQANEPIITNGFRTRFPVEQSWCDAKFIYLFMVKPWLSHYRPKASLLCYLSSRLSTSTGQELRGTSRSSHDFLLGLPHRHLALGGIQPVMVFPHKPLYMR